MADLTFDDLIPKQSGQTAPQPQPQALSFDDLVPQAQPERGWLDTAKDVGGAFAAGLARGAADLAGTPGMLQDVFNSGMSRLTGLPELPSSPLSGVALRGVASSATGGATDYKGEGTAAKYAGTVGEFVPGAAAFGGVSPGNLARFAALPGVASEAAGQATEGTWAEPYARAAAALVAPALPAMGAKLITPNPISAERAAMVYALRSEGVNPTAGQATGNRGLKYAEAELGGGAIADAVEQQGKAFTDAAMRRAGSSGVADPETMRALNDRLSTGFKDISARNTLTSDAQLGNDIGQTLTKYERVLPSEQKGIVQNLADDIIQRISAGGGKMSGTDYQTIRSRLSSAAHAARNGDTEYADALRGLRNSLDDAMGRSMTPEDVQEWARLRKEWGNMKVLEKAANGAGESAAMGIISPAKLRQAASSGRNGQYARAEGDFDELARAGEAILRPLPDSGTASRLNAKTLGGISAALGAGGGAAAGGPYAAIAGALMGTVAPSVAGRVLMSRPAQAYLSNQMLPPMRLADLRYAGIAEALLSQERARLAKQSR